jgi:hypothetical membrane protein
MRFSQKAGAAAGFIMPTVAFAFILSALATYPQFSWTNNALSDLGVVPGITSLLFNSGPILGGIAGVVFSALGLWTYANKRWAGKLGAAFFAGASIALLCIGIFNENFRPTHYIVSVAFFVLAPLALFLLTGAFYLRGNSILAALTVAVAVVAAAPWILQLTIHYVPDVAIPEAISAVAVSVWAVVVSAQMLKTKPA